MAKKKTNLALACDLTACRDVLDIADKTGPEICILKTHVDIIRDFTPRMIDELNELKKKHDFLIFEDRKFADIGNTVKHQYRDGMYRIAEWADIVNAHAVPGPGIIDGLKTVGQPLGRGLLLLAEMSSAGNLATDEYTEKTLAMARENKDFVIGFISMRRLLDDTEFISLTPGVKLAAGGDNLGQQYNTPEKVIGENRSDVIIVGRGIYEAEDPAAEAHRYKHAGWQAYLRREEVG